MDLKKCKSGHFYDGDKYSECPHCKNNVDKRTTNTIEKKKITENRESGNITKSIYDMKTPENKYEEPRVHKSEEAMANEQKPVYQPAEEKVAKPVKKNYEYGPVVGWLVGISGNEYGHSYELFATSNTIGNSLDNVVAISEDSHLCNMSHGVICYQVETGSFFFDSQHSGGKVKINNYMVQENVYINYMDVLEIGDSSYILIPLCKDGFSWWQTNTNTVNNQTSAQSAYLNQNIESFNPANVQVHNTSSANNIVVENIDEVMYQPDINYVGGYEGEEHDLTSVLISSPWRCDSCNALNAMMASKCRVCGSKK